MSQKINASEQESIVIVGAGVCGLTLAAKLLEAGVPNPVVLIEKESRVGGLARSFSYGDYIFDIGPHRFHSDNTEVTEFVREILGPDRIDIERSSGVWLFNKYHDWPLRPGTVLKLPFNIMLRCFFDLFFRAKAKTDNFEEYIIEHYGKTLYEVFFRPYTEKFIKYNCRDLHKDWASTGIDRAVIDKRIKAGSLFEVLQTTLCAPAVKSKFIYPKSGGNGVFCERLRDKIEDQGGVLLLSSLVDNFEFENNRISKVRLNNGQAFKVKHLFWTAPIPELISFLAPGKSVPRMEYISTVVANYMINTPPQTHYQWCYFGTADSLIQRISIQANFNPGLAPKGKSGLCVELTCVEGDATWRHPERMDAAIEGFLVRSEAVRKHSDIVGVHFEHIPNSYPLYTLNYKRKLSANLKEIMRFDNLLSLGRTGSFWYNNQDHSIQQAMEVAQAYLKESKSAKLRDIVYSQIQTG